MSDQNAQVNHLNADPNEPDWPLYVRDVTHPDGECPLHGTKGDCACTDTGLWGPKDYAAAVARRCAACGCPRSECRTRSHPFLSCCPACAAADGDTHG